MEEPRAHLVFSQRALAQQFIKADFIVIDVYLPALKPTLLVAVLGAHRVVVREVGRPGLHLNAAKISQATRNGSEL